jgi:hypothetical protein
MPGSDEDSRCFAILAADGKQFPDERPHSGENSRFDVSAPSGEVALTERAGRRSAAKSP